MVSKKISIDSVLKALADPTRRAIVEVLAIGPLAVGELAERFPMSRPAISKHLRLLEEAGLVVPEQEGRRRLCVFDPAPLGAVQGWLQGFEAPRRRPASRLGTPRERLAPVLEPATPSKPDRESRDWRVW